MKKVTSILVALMMLFSICTVVASATVNDAVAALRVTSTATSYNPGDEVTFEVSYETTSDLGGVGVCVITIGYDSDVFEPVEEITAAGTTLDKATTVSLTGYALDGKVSLANSFVQMKGELTSVDTAKGWDTALKIALTKDVGAAWIDASSEIKVLSFKLKVKADAVGGTHAVGITDGSIQDGTTSLDEEAGAVAGPSGPEYGFSQSKIFDLGDASLTVAGGTTPTPPPAATVKVNNIDAQVKWADKEANLINLGFRGQIAEGYDASADKTGDKGANGGDQLAKLTEVGFYINNSKVPAYTIYNFVTGGYYYRAVVANVDYQNTDVLSAKAYVVIDGKEYTAAEAFTTSAKAEYDEVKSSMEA